MLKYALIAFSLAQITVGEIAPEVNKAACLRDASPNPADVERAYSQLQVKNVRELKCYFRCYFENAGYMNTDRTINTDVLRANVPAGVSKTMAQRAIDTCATRSTNADACETAYLMQKCLLEHNLKY